MGGLPLEGTRIVELTQIYAGPYASMILADWGAELIRLETIQTLQPGTRGQFARVSRELMEQARRSHQWGMAYPNWEAGPRPWNQGAVFLSTGRNKLSMTVDLTRPKGREILGRLFEKTDVFIENNVPETLEKMNISYEWLQQVNPQIIMLRMPAFGLEGPYSGYRALGSSVDGVSGHAYIKGHPDVEPSQRGDSVAPDAVSGISGALSVLMALWYRRRTGKGQMVEMSLAESFIPFMAESILDYTMNGRVRESLGNRDHQMAPHGVYPCQGEDKWLAVAVSSDEEWQGLCEAMGNPGLASDSRFANAISRWHNQDELDSIISGWTRQQNHREVFHWLQQQGVAAGPILDELEVLEDPHLVERSYYQSMDHPEMPTMKYPGPLWQTSKTPNKLRLSPPLLGEHNPYVYKELLGISDEEYAQLEAEGHIGMDVAPHVL